MEDLRCLRLTHTAPAINIFIKILGNWCGGDIFAAHESMTRGVQAENSATHNVIILRLLESTRGAESALSK